MNYEKLERKYFELIEEMKQKELDYEDLAVKYVTLNNKYKEYLIKVGACPECLAPGCNCWTKRMEYYQNKIDLFYIEE